MITITVRGMNRVDNSLRKLASQMPQIVDKVMQPWAQSARAALKSTPYPAPNTRKMRWVSEKQRRYVMAAIRDGRIKVPYRRTGNLANRWSAQRLKPGSWEIKNSARYAVYVVGKNQYWMHAGRWWIASDEVSKLTGKLVDELTKELKRVWEAG